MDLLHTGKSISLAVLCYLWLIAYFHSACGVIWRRHINCKRRGQLFTDVVKSCALLHIFSYSPIRCDFAFNYFRFFRCVSTFLRLILRSRDFNNLFCFIVHTGFLRLTANYLKLFWRCFMFTKCIQTSYLTQRISWLRLNCVLTTDIADLWVSISSLWLIIESRKRLATSQRFDGYLIIRAQYNIWYLRLLLTLSKIHVRYV